MSAISEEVDLLKKISSKIEQAIRIRKVIVKNKIEILQSAIEHLKTNDEDAKAVLVKRYGELLLREEKIQEIFRRGIENAEVICKMAKKQDKATTEIANKLINLISVLDKRLKTYDKRLKKEGKNLRNYPNDWMRIIKWNSKELEQDIKLLNTVNHKKVELQEISVEVAEHIKKSRDFKFAKIFAAAAAVIFSGGMISLDVLFYNFAQTDAVPPIFSILGLIIIVVGSTMITFTQPEIESIERFLAVAKVKAHI